MQIKAAIGSFFLEYSKFETNFVGMALQALSKDTHFVVQSETLLGLEARLTLIERLAFARGISAKLIAELAELISRTRRLREQHHDVARALELMESSQTRQLGGNPVRKARSPRKRGPDAAQLATMQTPWTPSLSQIEAYSVETIELQNGMRAFAEQLDHLLS